MVSFTENEVEDAALGWLDNLGWQVVHDPDIAPDTLGSERDDYGEVVLQWCLRDALARLNPDLPAAALVDALYKPTTTLPPGRLGSNFRPTRLICRRCLP